MIDKWHLRFLRLAREVADALEAALHKENSND